MKTRIISKAFIIIIGFFQSQILYAQCPASATMLVTESRCRENGSITVNASPAGSYAYEISSGPELTAISSSNIFEGLGAGNYVITIHGSDTCKLDIFVTVPGTYADPGLLNATVANILCPGGTGCITAIEPANGRKPYTYSIIAGPVIRPSQVSKSFCGLPSGDYKLQAYDSCGVVRTSDFSVGVDTGDFYAFAYDWELAYANCNDVIITTYKEYTGTNSHSLLKVWYVTPDGDTIKANSYNSLSTDLDTLTGMANKFGTWQIVVFDECNRQRTNTFEYYYRSIWIPTFDAACGGTSAAIDNPWRFGVGVGYTVKKCSNDSVVFHEYVTASNADWWSNHFFLEYDTCYYFESYNECGETVNWTGSFAKSALDISACPAPSCSVNGRVQITLTTNSSNLIKPIKFTIIAGPGNVGATTSIVGMDDWMTRFEDLAPGIYTIAVEDACTGRDTVVVNANNPLRRTIEVTQKPNCSGGANVHVKVTSNYFDCYDYSTGGGEEYTTYVDETFPAYNPVNTMITGVTETSDGIWEADYLNVNSNTLKLTLKNYSGCTHDTTITINKYIPPALANMKGYVCSATGIATLYYNVNDGVGPYQFRIKSSSSVIWGPWQDSSIFTGVSVGTYDVNVEDACPNGSIRSINFTDWQKSAVKLSSPCATIGSPITMSADPALDVVNYEWMLNGSVIASGPTYTIPSFAVADNGEYKLRQNYRGGTCVDSSAGWVLSCSVLSINFGEFSGKLLNNSSSLKWNTTKEVGQVTFIIERGYDGRNFKKLGELKSKEQANGAEYNFIDKNPLSDNFYRVRFLNEAGKQQYSNIVRIAKNELVKTPVKIRPVPFRSWFVIEVKSDKQALYNISVYDLVGNRVAKRMVNIASGTNTIWFDHEVENLASGYYFVEVTGPAFTQRNKILKQ